MSRNDITLDNIRTHAPSKAYDDGYDRIFGRRTKLTCAARGCKGCFICEYPAPDTVVQKELAQP